MKTSMIIEASTIAKETIKALVPFLIHFFVGGKNLSLFFLNKVVLFERKPVKSG